MKKLNTYEIKRYKDDFEKWNHERKTVARKNDELIKEWRSIPWWKFWVYKPSFETQMSIVVGNWESFRRRPAPLIENYIHEHYDIKKLR